jgi:adenylate cyclase
VTSASLLSLAGAHRAAPRRLAGALAPSPGAGSTPSAYGPPPRRYGCAIEIERKFLVPAPPDDLERWPSTAIEQGYLAIAENGPEVRVRRRDGRAWLTVKSGEGRVRVEEEIEIEPERFKRLWPLTEGRRIEKTRYEIPAIDGLVIELDVYRGDLEGLVTAEVEFPSEEAAEAYDVPDWLGADVTEDPRYKNQRLALDGAP